MRQILVEQARRKASLKRGGDRKRLDMEQADPVIAPPVEDLLALDEALTRLEKAEVAVPRELFAAILERIQRFGVPPPLLRHR